MKLHDIIFSKPLINDKPSAWIKHIPFAFFIVEKAKPKIFVELGVHFGNSYFAFAQAIKELNLPAAAYAVDHWNGDEQAGFYSDDAYIYVEKQNQKYFSQFSTLVRMDFDQAKNYFANGSIDLLHIDGFHTYEAVKHDFETWLPYMSKRGIVLLHDTQEKKKDFGVWKLMEELREKYPSCEFLHGHGLGIVCTGKEIDQDIAEFVFQCNKDAFIQNVFSTLGRIVHGENIWFRNKPGSENIFLRFARISLRGPDGDTENCIVLVHRNEDSMCRLAFHFHEKQNISTIRFEPLNHIIRLKLLNIGFYKDNLRIEIPFSVSSNAVFDDKTEYLFDSDSPFIDIKFSEELVNGINRILMDAEYLEEDRGALRLALQFKGLIERDHS